MLVLTRKQGEKVFIGPDIVLAIVRVTGGQVRIGIEAPAEVSIRRAELGEAPPGTGRSQAEGTARDSCISVPVP
jgi:carbon storage regulator